MTLSTLLALLVVFVAAPLSWLVTIWLWRLSRKAPKVRPLSERTLAAFTLAVIVTVFAAVFVNNEQAIPPLDLEATRVLTRGTLFVCSVIPAARWIWMARS